MAVSKGRTALYALGGVLLVSAGGLVAPGQAEAASGPATHFVVTVPSTLAQGTGITISVTAEDANGNVATSYTGTVAVSSSDPLFVPTPPITLTKGKGTFYSGLFTAGQQTVTASDTVTSSITGTSAPIDVERPVAATIAVTGSSLAGISASPEALSPSFAANETDYVLACPAEAGNSVSLTLSAPPGGTIDVNGQSGSSVVVPEVLHADQAVVISAPVPSPGSGTRSYWIRCLPPDFPSLSTTVTRTPPPGYLLTGTGQLTQYVMVLNSVGVPVWWRSTGHYTPANLQVLEGDTLGWGWGFTNTQPLYDLGTGTYRYEGSNAHELYQLPDGDFLGLYYTTKSGVDLSGIGLGANQTISDCQVQEYTPQLQLVWTWTASDHISPDESQLPTYAGGQWDVYHCNSIDVDPQSVDPNNPNLLVSMRDTNAVYYVENPESATNPGDVLWKLGGGTPVSGSQDADVPHYVVTGGENFYAQHDARFEPDGNISVFDDGSPAEGSTSCQHAARGVQVYLHKGTDTATANWQFAAPSGLCATFEGSFRRYDGGNDNVIGWGSATNDFISEVNRNGQPFLTISSPSDSDVYRAIKVPTSALDLGQLREDMGGLAPAVTSVSPTSGPDAGGTTVTISGRGLTQASSVDFGSTPAASFTVESDGAIDAVSPSGATGSVAVTVTTPAGTSKGGPKTDFTYTG